MSSRTEGYTRRGWRPQAGDTVAGEVVDISSTDGGYGPHYVITLREENGEEADVHAFHTVLRNELARRNVQIGDRIAIEYLGRVTGGRGSNGYDAYRVKGGKTPVVNWGSEAGGDADEPVEPDVPIAGFATETQDNPQGPIAAATEPGAGNDDGSDFPF